MITKTGFENQFTDLTQNTSTTNTSRGLRLVNQSLKYLTEKYYFNEATHTDLTVAQQQQYRLPYDIKDIINCTVLVGGVLWQPLEAPSRQMWDSLNTIPFYSDFPQFFYRFTAAYVNLFPVPASAGNTLTVNYKRRIIDLSASDYTTGTVTVATATKTVTGSGTSWTANMADRWLNIPLTTSNTTTGDDAWYQIASVQSATSLTLYNNYAGTTISAGTTYTIGDIPILPEDYQDLALYRSLWIYYTSIVPNLKQAQSWQGLYLAGKEILDQEFSAKSSNPVLTPPNAPVFNPNFFPRVT